MTPQFPDALTQTVHLFREIAKQDVSHPFLCRTTHGKRTDENRLPVTGSIIPLRGASNTEFTENAEDTEILERERKEGSGGVKRDAGTFADALNTQHLTLNTSL
jgi:hypothetical protein